MVSETIYLNSKKAKKVTVCMMNKTKSVWGKVYFITNQDHYFDGNKLMYFPIIPNDDDFREYTFDISQSLYWKDIITQFRINPCDSEGICKIKYIKIN